MGQDDEATGLIGTIYDSVDADRGWSPVLEGLADEVSAGGVQLFVRHSASGQFVEEHVYGYAGFNESDEELQDRFESMLPTDPAFPIGLQNPNKIIHDVDHYSHAMLERTPVYNEVLKLVGSHYRMTSVLALDEGLSGGFAVTRPKRAGSFDKKHLRRVETLLPHILRSLRLQKRMRQLEQDANNIAAALDRLPTAGLIVSDKLEIVCMNRQADGLLASCKSLRVRRSELVPERASEASELRKAVSEAIALADGASDGPIAPPQVVAVSRAEKLPLEVLAVPLRPRYQVRQTAGGNARALLLIYDPHTRPSIDPGLIERLFDLTHTEAFVAARLAEGCSITEIAEERRCSASTVRTHVKRIFAKTRTNRQGELVQLLLTSPAISFGG